MLQSIGLRWALVAGFLGASLPAAGRPAEAAPSVHAVARVSRDAGGFRVEDVLLAPGPMPGGRRGATGPGLRFEALDAEGRRIGTGFVPDPSLLRGDLPVPGSSAGLRAVQATRERSWFPAKIPLSTARLRFLEGSASAGAARVLGEVPCPGARAATLPAAGLESLVESGPSANRVNLVVLGDGYRAQDQDKLSADAGAFVKGLFASVPFSEYQGFFNVTLVHVVSAQEGADGGALGDERDTALDAAFGCGGEASLLCVDDQKALALALEVVPDADEVLVIVNESRCGGSGGATAVFSTCETFVDAAVHELGHAFGLLGDEYVEGRQVLPCDGECPEPNVSTRSDRKSLKWGAWVSPYVPLPTPDSPVYASVVGAFEGARYQAKGVFRPQSDCRMRTLSSPFDAVCAETLILALHDRVSLVEDPVPATGVALAPEGSVRLSVASPPGPPIPFEHAWTVDDVAVAGAAGPALDVAAASLGPGTHRVRIEVRDPTPRVLRDLPRMASAHEWTVVVAGAEVPDGAGGLDGADGGAEEASPDDAVVAPGDDSFVDAGAEGARASGCGAGKAGVDAAVPGLLGLLLLACLRASRPGPRGSPRR